MKVSLRSGNTKREKWIVFFDLLKNNIDNKRKS
jgi:hypothetical protein